MTTEVITGLTGLAKCKLIEDSLTNLIVYLTGREGL